jgi:hypothetical protein
VANAVGGALACVDGSAPHVEDCVLSSNLAAAGAAVGVLEAYPVIGQCTLVGNAAAGYGGAIHCSGGQAVIGGCILWGNAAADGPELSLASGATVGVSFSDVAGGQAAVYLGPGSTLEWFDGNLSIDPLFKRDGVHLRLRSPCRNAGDPVFVPDPGRTDIDGEARALEGRVDQGADEVALDLLPAILSGPPPGPNGAVE